MQTHHSQQDRDELSESIDEVVRVLEKAQHMITANDFADMMMEALANNIDASYVVAFSARVAKEIKWY